MAEYIERGKLRDKIAYLQNQRESNGQHLLAEALDIVLLAIDNAPAADVVPVMRGKWIIKEFPISQTKKVTCSRCGYSESKGPAWDKSWGLPHGCPNCLARMDGEG